MAASVTKNWADLQDEEALAEQVKSSTLGTGAAEEPTKPALPPKTIDDKILLASAFVSQREVFNIDGVEVTDDQRVLVWEVSNAVLMC